MTNVEMIISLNINLNNAIQALYAHKRNVALKINKPHVQFDDLISNHTEHKAVLDYHKQRVRVAVIKREIKNLLH